MSPRPLPVTVAAILLALVSLFLGVFTSVHIIIGLVGIFVARSLWLMEKWSIWATVIFCVLHILIGVLGVVMRLFSGLDPQPLYFAVLTLGFVLITVLVLLPSTRRALATT